MKYLNTHVQPSLDCVHRLNDRDRAMAKKTKSSKRITKQSLGLLVEVEVGELATIGWIQITSIGEENLYFSTPDGTKHFCKVSN